MVIQHRIDLMKYSVDEENEGKTYELFGVVCKNAVSHKYETYVKHSQEENEESKSD